MVEAASQPKLESASPLLEVRAVTKKFGDLVANDAVDLTIKSGEIHAFLGENGAGKSTLVKIIFGSLQPNAGQILWRGSPVNINSPADARALGIGMVFQHFSLFEALTVAENIALSFSSDTDLQEIEARTTQLSRQYGLPLDPRAVVGDLSVGERQRVEIIRCLMQDPALIILDEPTSVLTPQEADTLFETLFRLRDEGRAILYISHRLDEVKRLCSTATILRHGKVVDACDPRKETAATLAAKMVGADLDDVIREKVAFGETAILQVNGLSVSASHPFAVALRNINLAVHPGEVLCIAGIAGNGQGELFDAISGEITQDRADTILIDSQTVGNLGISQRRKLGAAFVPEERLGHGAVPGMKLTDNMLLARHESDADAFGAMGRLKVILRDAIAAATKRVSAAMDVRKSSENPAASALSGGNLQKFLMGRELDRKPRLLVVNQPTWGVDAGAATFIRQSLIDLATSGSAVLVISQDLDEVFEIATTIAVIADGQLSAAEPAAAMNRERIGLMMTGTKPATKAA
ncbi:ABC transporter ATP-binding protein [Pseudahrensia aquimaris]|uniref:ABC transporter ATP-binding protein n=1 Tax=Pseudahrensia aquimaris TaxID=744461 RepID=A0ABW3FHJ7_9HYPH